MLSLRSTQDQGFHLLVGVATLAYLWADRDSEVEGSDLLLPTFPLPSILGALLAFGVVIGPAYALAMEREDGTLLRHKALPHGMQGYVTGQLLYHSLNLLPLLLVILVPSFLLFDDVMSNGLAGWVTVAWVVVLGLLATLPIIVLTMISGIFYPIQALWGWVQVVAQVFPTYWIGLGMRSAFLPDAAATVAVGDSWRTGLTGLVLGGWAVVGLLVTPRVLLRMARRTPGSQEQEAKEAALQWVE